MKEWQLPKTKRRYMTPNFIHDFVNSILSILIKYKSKPLYKSDICPNTDFVEILIIR